MRKTRKKCCVKGCRNFARHWRTKCARHLQAEWRAAHPVSAAFAALRDHARERGIPFTITRVQFECFAKLSGYVEKKGNGAHCLTVDRIDNLKGYVPGNIQPMTRSENSVKRAKQDAMRMRAGYAWQGGCVEPEPEFEELPDSWEEVA